MASYDTTTIHRPSTTTITTATTSSTDQTDESKDPTQKNRNNPTLVCAFNIPSTPEAAAVRIIRNLGSFGFFYATFVWLILFIALLPQRKVSMIFLLAMTLVTLLYLLLLRLLPDSALLHKIIVKWLVLPLLFIATMVEMVLTRAAIHFFVTLAGATPVIMVHAVLTVRDYLFVNQEGDAAAGELIPLVSKETDSV